MYRVYHGILQPGRPAISRQTSVVDTRSLSRQDTCDISAINRRWNRLNSASSVISESSSYSSSCENNASDIPKCKRVTFPINPSLTIHEHSDTDNNNIIGECVVINNEKAVVEIEVEA